MLYSASKLVMSSAIRVQRWFRRNLSVWRVREQIRLITRTARQRGQGGFDQIAQIASDNTQLSWQSVQLGDDNKDHVESEKTTALADRNAPYELLLRATAATIIQSRFRGTIARSAAANILCTPTRCVEFMDDVFQKAADQVLGFDERALALRDATAVAIAERKHEDWLVGKIQEFQSYFFTPRRKDIDASGFEEGQAAVAEARDTLPFLKGMRLKARLQKAADDAEKNGSPKTLIQEMKAIVAEGGMNIKDVRAEMTLASARAKALMTMRA